MAKAVYKNGKVVYEQTEAEKQVGAKAMQNAYTEEEKKNLISQTQQQAEKLSSGKTPQTTAESVDLTKTMNSYEANLKRLNALGYDVSEQTSAVDKLKQQRSEYLSSKPFAPATPVYTPDEIASGAKQMANTRSQVIEQAKKYIEMITMEFEQGQILDVLDLVNETYDRPIMLTLEPHLNQFTAFASIDTHKLKGKYSFKDNTESFDFAVKALEALLTKGGYKQENGRWKK